MSMRHSSKSAALEAIGQLEIANANCQKVNGKSLADYKSKAPRIKPTGALLLRRIRTLSQKRTSQERIAREESKRSILTQQSSIAQLADLLGQRSRETHVGDDQLAYNAAVETDHVGKKLPTSIDTKLPARLQGKLGSAMTEKTKSQPTTNFVDTATEPAIRVR